MVLRIFQGFAKGVDKVDWRMPETVIKKMPGLRLIWIKNSLKLNWICRTSSTIKDIILYPLAFPALPALNISPKSWPESWKHFNLFPTLNLSQDQLSSMAEGQKDQGEGSDGGGPVMKRIDFLDQIVENIVWLRAGPGWAGLGGEKFLIVF